MASRAITTAGKQVIIVGGSLWIRYELVASSLILRLSFLNEGGNSLQKHRGVIEVGFC